MKCFVVLSLFSACLAAPATINQIHVNAGVPAGPLTAAFGDLVSTPKGLRSYALEGFSEDLDQDGFVDPVGQAVIHAPVVAPVITYAHAPLVHAVKPVEVKEVKAPVVTYASPFLGYGYGLGLGLGHLGGFPFIAPVAKPAEAAAEEPAVEEARKKREADPEADPLLFSYSTGAIHPTVYGGYPVITAPVAEVKAVEAPVAEVKAVATPLVYSAPAVHAIAPAAVATYTTPVVHQVPAVAYQTYTNVHPFTTVQKHVSTYTTRHVINHAPVIGASVLGAPVPFGVVAPAAAAPAEDAPAVEEA
jgi:hypothetical protein